MNQAPELPPCVVVHGPADVRMALVPGRPVTLLSAPGAALFAGRAWWRAMVDAALAGHAGPPVPDVLDCADAPGMALAAIGAGQRLLVLDPACPAFPALARLARAQGATLLDARPPALDLAHRDGARRLVAWLG